MRGIVRNRAKIEATIANARAVADLDIDLGELLWSFAPPPRPRPADLADVPAVTPESTAMAKELKRRGFRFVGPTTAYALMQATGMVDDHLAVLLGPATACLRVSRSWPGLCTPNAADREQWGSSVASTPGAVVGWAAGSCGGSTRWRR